MAGKSRLMSNLPILTPELFFSILYHVNTTVNTIESASITYALNGQVRKTVQGKSSSSGPFLATAAPCRFLRFRFVGEEETQVVSSYLCFCILNRVRRT